jgi:hypothetical protein
MVQITYTCVQHPYVANPPGVAGQTTPRPWVEVTVDPAGAGHRVWCLVDTGADDTILDLGTATALGVFTPTLPQVSITLGSGAQQSYGLLTNVTLAFAGAVVPAPGQPQVDVLLGAVALPVLGRSALVAAGALAGVGFEAARWMHT